MSTTKTRFASMASSLGQIRNEVPKGVIDGQNAIFVTKFPFDMNSLAVFIGIRLTREVDYTCPDNNTIIFFASPEPPEKVIVDYRRV